MISVQSSFDGRLKLRCQPAGAREGCRQDSRCYAFVLVDIAVPESYIYIAKSTRLTPSSCFLTLSPVFLSPTTYNNLPNRSHLIPQSTMKFTITLSAIAVAFVGAVSAAPAPGTYPNCNSNDLYRNLGLPSGYAIITAYDNNAANVSADPFPCARADDNFGLPHRSLVSTKVRALPLVSPSATPSESE